MLPFAIEPRACLADLPKFSADGGPTLMPFLYHVQEGWLVCGRPMTIAQGLAVSIAKVPGLYESRQAWLDRHEIGGGLRELYETCWRVADSELEADLDKLISESMKSKD